MKDPVVQHVGRLFRAYKAGHLPAPGSLRNQSQLYRTVIDYCLSCQDEATEYNQQKLAEQRAKQQKQQ